MRDNLRGALIAGLISSVIWMIISTAVDLGKSAVIVGGLAFLVGTGLVTAAISRVISRSHTSG